MFREMRKKEREVLGGNIDEVLEKGEYGTLSTMGEDGYPYAVPLSYVYYKDDIYFHCASAGYKLDNIGRNSKVSFCVVTDTEVLPSKFSTKYKSVIIFGTASEVTGEMKKIVLQKLIEKYSKDFLEEGIEYIERAAEKTRIIKISIEHVTGKARYS